MCPGDGIRDVSVELQECVWRCDELLEHRKAEETEVKAEICYMIHFMILYVLYVY